MSNRRVGALALMLGAGLTGTAMGQDTTSTTITGWVRYPDGTPIRGAKVMLMDVHVGTVTASDGSYTLITTPGRGIVRASTPGYKPLEMEGLRLPAGSIVTQDFTLSPMPGAGQGGGAMSIDQVDEPVRALTGPSPKYPPELKAAGISGTVELRFVVGVNGEIEPESLRILASTNKAFEAPALDAIKAWKFAPARIRGQPVRQIVQQAVKFAP